MEQVERAVEMHADVVDGALRVSLTMDARTALELHSEVMWGARSRHDAATVAAVRDCLGAVRAAQSEFRARVADDATVMQGVRGGWYTTTIAPWSAAR